MKIKVATKIACDFCKRSQDDVKALIVGYDSAAICGECVAKCVTVLLRKQVGAKTADEKDAS
ncbi:ATP-dependent protease Clp ATPase subunit [Oxalobacteraceae bacterium GrIS 1.11]